MDCSSGPGSAIERILATCPANVWFISSAPVVAKTPTLRSSASPSLLRLALAWEIQASALGGLPRGVSTTLDQLERGQTTTRAPTAGLRLVREWAGEAHVVLVSEDRIIRWNGREWNSLSEVARAITGTRWSGPAFFGLKKRVAA
ncbi:DUF2924 domain-containing protein [Sphingomonas sp. GC_Shp_2]|nr:DUF2924 domain-containing protein [Sphingomonas sp. GC_Shp_2]